MSILIEVRAWLAIAFGALPFRAVGLSLPGYQWNTAPPDGGWRRSRYSRPRPGTWRPPSGTRRGVGQAGPGLSRPDPVD